MAPTSTIELAKTKQPTDAYLADLNDRQRAAILHTEGPCIVIAGAGSGKTKVLTARIAHVLKEKKAIPSQILALTFTNKAAAEMLHRIEAIVGHDAQKIWFGTFHKVFVRLLRREAASIGYPAHFTIYDSEDSKSLIKQIIKELHLDDKVYRPATILSRISHAKNRLITAESYAQALSYQAEDAAIRLPRFSEIFLRYTRACTQANALDFDDLLLQTYRLLEENPTLSQKYQTQFRYIFIDEFQDTNLVQYRIAQHLAAMHQNICVVGDDAQSIYAFRGADIQNILHFAHDYPTHQIIKLEQNYRSTQHIVEVANCIISHNEGQLKKKVWTNNLPGPPIELLQTASDLLEGQLIADSISTQKLQQQLHYRDFAILYRTNNQSRSFEEALRKRNIPYHIVGGLSFYQRKEVKELLAYLRFAVNNNDTEAFKRIINVPKRGIGPATLAKIFAVLTEKSLPLWTLLCNPTAFISGPSIVPLSNFATLMQAVQGKLMTEEENAYSIATYLAQASGLLKELYEDKTIEGLTRYEHIQELLNSIKQFVDHPHNHDTSLAHFLQEITLMTNGDEQKTQEDAVTLMTIHAAKGLEFKSVCLVGLEEEYFPGPRMVGNKADLEEERRLFYVAVTRAKLHLTLSYARSRYRFGKLLHTHPSRFLQEIRAYLNTQHSMPPISSLTNRTSHVNPSTLKKNSNLNCKAPQKPIGNPGTSLSSQATSCDIDNLAIGRKVRHATFGEGQIMHLIESEGLHKAIIFFHKFGEKTLLLKYAKLDVLPYV